MLALLFALTVQTNDPSAAAALLARGEKLLADLEYDAAAAELMRAAAAPDANDEERLKAHLLAGIANRVAGRDTEARLNFRNVLLAAPDTHLPPSTSPKVLSFFEAVRQEVLAERASQSSPVIVAPAPLAPDTPPETTTSPNPVPPPDPRAASGPWPWMLAGTGGVAAAVTGLAFGYTYVDASARKERVPLAQDVYLREPNRSTRAAFVDEARNAEGAMLLNNCVALPLACLCVPGGLGALVGGVVWGVYDGANESEGSNEKPGAAP